MSGVGSSVPPQAPTTGGKAPLPLSPKPASPLLGRQSPKVPKKSPVLIRKAAAAANGHVEYPPAGSSGTQNGNSNL